MFRYLLIAPIYAASLRTGGGQRTFHISKALARFGEVDLLLVSEPAFADAETTVGDLKKAYPHVGDIVVHRSTEQFFVSPSESAGRLAKTRYLSSRLFRSVRPQRHFYQPTSAARDELARRLERRQYTALVGRYLKTTALSGAFAQAAVPVLVDLDDLEDKLLSARVGAGARPLVSSALFRFQYWQVRSILQRLRQRCAHLFAASERDRLFIGMDRCSVLPNIPLVQDALPAKAAAAPEALGEVVLFVGSHAHGANRDGVIRFVEQSWPAVQRALPAARLRIVGSGGWDSLRTSLETTRGVEVVGTVDDLAGEYARATLAVVPIDEGSGTKIKVLEALMHRRPVLASEHAARGYETLIGRGIVTASGARQLSSRCVELLGDPAQCERLAAAGQAIVRQQFSFQAVLDALESGLIRAAAYAAGPPGAG